MRYEEWKRKVMVQIMYLHVNMCRGAGKNTAEVTTLIFKVSTALTYDGIQ